MLSKKKAPIVSERVDDFIGSLSLAFTFIILGVLLTVYDDFVGDMTITSIIRWVFVVIGGAGLFFSFGDKDSDIKGTGDVGTAIVVLAIAVPTYQCAPKPVGAVLALLLLIFGVYGMLHGIMFLIYTTYNSSFRGANGSAGDAPLSLGRIVSLSIELISKLAALVLVFAQLYKIFLELQ